MSAIHVLRRRSRWSAILSLGLVAVLAIPVGCGEQASTGDATKASPKAGERRREMENFMKNEKKQ
jgi:hypothetical protein